MTNLAEKYGIKANDNVIGEINLNENPYKFEGTFKEFYNLVAEGNVKALKQGNSIVGISVSGYDTIEADSLAGEAFGRAYSGYQAIKYLNIATQLIEANLIPTEITENPLRITILNGLVTLDENLNEVKQEVEPEVNVNPETGEVIDEDDEIVIPSDVADYNVKKYIRKTYGRCLARGSQPNITYDENRKALVVKNIQWGRKLTQEEIDAITY